MPTIALVLGMALALVSTAQTAPRAYAATSTLGGINVEPSARPWQYLGANPDGWWCPSAAQCTTSNPLGRIDTEMALAQQLHVSNLRLEIPWFLVEPARGSYDWTRADYIFNSAAGHGIVLQPILVYTPSWDGGYNAFPPAADFGTFVSAFMGRYGGRINAIEMWNEPDGGQSLVANNPAEYVQSILIPGYNAVKASHPAVAVIEGGSINDSGTCCSWLTGIFAAGGGAYFNVAAFHDYGGNYGTIAQAYRNVLNAHGKSSTPIWMGEYGVSDATGTQQTSLINAALTATPGLAMAQFYTLRDESVYTCCPPAATGEHKQYGVVAADDVTKKSSFYTMQSLLGGSPPPPTSQPSPPPPATTPPPAESSPLAAPSPVRPSSAASPSHSPSSAHSPSSSGSPGSSPAGGSSAGTSGGGDSGTFGQTVVANRQLSGRAAVALEVILLVLAIAGLAVAAWGIALARNVAVVAASRVNTLVGRRRSMFGVGVAAVGLLITFASVVLMPLR